MKHSQQKSQTLNEKEIITLLGEFFVLKAKTYSQNSVADKYKMAIYLSMKHSFNSFAQLDKFCSDCVRLGLISTQNLKCITQFIKHFVTRNTHFQPTMPEQEYIHYFFNLTKRLKISTINQHYRMISLFLRFLAQKGINTINLKGIHMSFLKDKKLPSFLNDFQYKQFLNEVKMLEENTLKDKIHKLALLFVAYTGIRRRELGHICKNDIQENATQYIIKIKGKCSQERFVSIKKSFVGNLLNDLLEHRENMGLNHQYVFSYKKDKPNLHIQTPMKPILQKIKAVQIRGNNLHLLRHSFASFVYRESRDILLTQKALGHASLNNTQIYVHMNEDVHNQVSNFF